ncbi:MAG: flagellar hook-basal body protein [Clostridiales bacterium]|nr:flagellar hook-basal body protein [Clostridiales bacterium]
MLKGLYTAYTGMVNEQHRMDVLTNNLANANTNGYKKEGATSQAFDDVLAYKIKDMSEGRGTAKRLGVNNLGVKVGEDYTDYSQGPVKGTENPFDLALSGEGFFTVQYTDKEGDTSIKYTRDGSFTMNSQGYLVTHDGDYVLNTSGARIKLNPLLDFRVDTSGNIMQGEENTPVATLRIRDFEDYNYLEKFGENYFQPVEGSRFKDATAKVNQGYLETSNISVVTEMTNMINVSRAYETNQKVIQTYDSSLEIAVNQIGKL